MTGTGVHVVVLNWNGGAETPACLDSLSALVPSADAIHVVDNGSTDGSLEACVVRHPAICVHRNGRNLGFAAGANVGIRAALERGARFVLLMNSDARMDPPALGHLLAAARANPAAGLLGGRIYRDRVADRLWCCGVEFRFGPNLAVLRGFDRAGRGLYLVSEDVPSLTGCGLLVRREVFERVGLLDEAFFVYVEDADFAERARRAGFSCRYVAEAILEHPGAGSTGGGYSRGRKYLTAHGSVLFLRRHGTLVRWAAFWICDVLAWPLVFIMAWLRGDGPGALAKLRGTLDALRGHPADLQVLERRS